MPAYQPVNTNLMDVLLGRANKVAVTPNHDVPSTADFSPLGELNAPVGALTSMISKIPGAAHVAEEIPRAGGAITPPGIMQGVKKAIYRGSNDVARMLQPEASIPNAPNTMGHVKDAFSSYNDMLASLLKRGVGR